MLSADVEEIFELLELLRMCFLLNSEPKKERKENSHGNVRSKKWDCCLLFFIAFLFVECLLNYNFEITYIALKSLTGRYKAILSLEKKILVGIEQ